MKVLTEDNSGPGGRRIWTKRLEGVLFQHAADVAQVFLGTNFRKELQLAEDDVLHGRHRDRSTAQQHGAPPLQSPRVKRVRAHQVDVRLERAGVVDDVEVPVCLTAGLHHHHLFRRDVELLE
jgi:hypothetical protein